MEYICPICKKVFSSVSEVTACVNACAKKEKQESLNKAETKVKSTYEVLKEAIKEYNKLSIDRQYYSTLETVNVNTYEKGKPCKNNCDCNKNKSDNKKSEIKRKEANISDFESELSDFLNTIFKTK